MVEMVLNLIEDGHVLKQSYFISFFLYKNNYVPLKWHILKKVEVFWLIASNNTGLKQKEETLP